MKRVTYPMVRATPEVKVPVRRVEWTYRLGRWRRKFSR